MYLCFHNIDKNVKLLSVNIIRTIQRDLENLGGKKYKKKSVISKVKMTKKCFLKKNSSYSATFVVKKLFPLGGLLLVLLLLKY